MTKTRRLPIFTILALCLFVFYSVDKSTSAQIKKDAAPSFSLKLLNGGELKSSDLKGKVTVLKFVASY